MKTIAMMVLSILLFGACKKKHPENTWPDFKFKQTSESQTYFPKTKGSYWIYEHVTIDSLGNESISNRYDSTYVVGDTVIQHKIYTRFAGNTLWGNYYVRDSGQYVVTHEGNIIYSNVDGPDTLTEYVVPQQTPFHQFFFTMRPTKDQVTTKAGTFTTRVFSGDHFLVMQKRKSITKQNHYAKNVGLVLETYFYSLPVIFSNKYTERRLVRYFIAPEPIKSN